MRDTILHGDALETLKSLSDESVHCVVTSPPYWGLRDYGTNGQLGLEPTPAEYIDNMVRIFAEVRRVLRADGTLWLNMGDCYANILPKKRWNGADDYESQEGGITSWRGGRHGIDTVGAGLKPKNLVGMPWRLALALQADGWYLRSDIIWAKPNPMPESVTDRPTKSHEYVFLLSKNARYFYDADAVREPHVDYREGKNDNVHRKSWKDTDNPEDERFAWNPTENKYNPLGRNKRDVWSIATQPMPEAHFATFPEKLIDPCIRAGTSEHGVCSNCGAPWVRVVERSNVDSKRNEVIEYDNIPGLKPGTSHDRVRGLDGKNYQHVRKPTNDWQPSCTCNAETTQAVVLDPFMGAGTVALVSKKLNRYYIGIELNQEYINIANSRLQQMSLFLGV